MLQGWQMLEENINRITTFVKEFLEFARGRTPDRPARRPQRIARQGRGAVQGQGGDGRHPPGLRPRGPGSPSAFMDEEGIHACLVNLVSNALDACETSDRPDPRGHGPHPRRRTGRSSSRWRTTAPASTTRSARRSSRPSSAPRASGKGTGLGLLDDPQDRPAARRQGVVRVDGGRGLGLPAGVPPRPAAPSPDDDGGRSDRTTTDGRKSMAAGLRTRPFWSSTTSPTSGTT